jgi:isocitrate dehydrogenase (NAD+)
MLRHLDEMAAADKAQGALEAVYTERKTLTRDVGGTAGTTQFTDAILAAMA